jgi:Xaa-Pro aminopeptidase
VDVLIYGDTLSCPELRHELPLAITDPFLYIEAGGRRAALTSVLEEERIAAAAPGIELLLPDALGRDQLVAAGLSWQEIERELCLRAAAALGVREARVPGSFPLGLADRMRSAAIALTPDEAYFDDRRRRKNAAELTGIRRATAAAIAALGEASRMLREAAIVDGLLVADGRELTAEAVRERIREVCGRVGCPAPADIMVRPVPPELGSAHDPGSGRLPADTPIEIDLWPRDEASGCWADVTRTLVRGSVSDALLELYALVLEAHRRACAATAPGVRAEALYDVVCDVFEAGGQPTRRTKQAGVTLREGFYFALGHGVGLQVHEAPVLSLGGTEHLVAGDVIALEPGTYVSGLGGARVEDLLVVTEDGYENLTAGLPYDLTA